MASQSGHWSINDERRPPTEENDVFHNDNDVGTARVARFCCVFRIVNESETSTSYNAFHIVIQDNIFLARMTAICSVVPSPTR